MIAAKSRLAVFVRGFFRFTERLRPSQWVIDKIKLPPGKNETEAGEISFLTRPYLRKPIDCIDEPTVTDIVFVGPTRCGKTFFLRMLFAWSIGGDPAPVLWVDSTEPKAKDISKKELQPLVEYNAILRDRKPANRHNFTDLRMLFPAAAFTMVGGNSDAQVAGDTVKRVLGNELDKWRGKTDKEASIAELVRHRTESFDDERKHAWGCTPTLEEMTTWQFFLRGDQCKWFCPCPRCGTLQELVWRDKVTGAGVVWDPTAKLASGKWDLVKVKATARYSCVKADCTAHDPTGAHHTGWTNAERRQAYQDVAGGADFFPTAVGEPGWRSFHVNGLYGPLKSNDTGALAVDFLSARNTGFYSDRQDFWNSRMGMPWKDEISDVTVQQFATRERQYSRGSLPDRFVPAVIIIGADVQSNRMPYVVRGIDWEGNSYLIDHGDAPRWLDLEGVQADYHKKWPGADNFLIVDINYEERRAEALEQIYVRKHLGWYGAEAFEFAKELVRLEQADAFLGGRLANQGHKVTKIVISSYEFKIEMEKRFAGEIQNWFCYQLDLASGETEQEEQKEYYKQLLDERRVPRKIRIQGKPAFEFKARTKNNHAFDCEVYILALFRILQKTRSYAARKPDPSAARKTITVST